MLTSADVDFPWFADVSTILLQTVPFPQYPWAIRTDLDADLQEKIKTVFYKLDDKAVLKPLKADGLAPITDQDYDVVRQLKTDLKL